ncbi:MAG: hypothetical protein GF307_10105 [candidate division Zixibacteria bacterium]|nr:hypothetical protein [candidate division Zixibacteria bacterium]
MPWFRDFFNIGKTHVDPKERLTEEELAAIDEMSQAIVNKHLTVAAIMFLESVKPMNWIGSQGMIVAEPLAHPILNAMGGVIGFEPIKKLGKNYHVLQRAFEKRETIEIMLQKIEELDAVQYQKERELKKLRKKNKKGFLSRFKRKKEGDKS